MNSQNQNPWPPISTKGEIRILELLPGGPDNPIECKIRSVLLADKPHYEAVSYVWGGRDALMTVQVSGFVIQVTKNLFTILQHFRYPDRKRILWIDQLCINQNDSVDKTGQVSLMGDIYRNCAECQVWLGGIEELGLSVPDAENAFTAVREMANPNNCLKNHVPLMFTSDEGASGARRAFRNIFTNFGSLWWTRIWTVQEVILPSKATMNCGKLKIDLELVKLAATNQLEWKLPKSCYRASQTFAPELDVFDVFVPTVRGLEETRNGEPALHILWRWRHRQASDPRDMIYALMGIFPLDTPWTMAPDYTLSTAQVFSRATVELIRQTNNLAPMIGRRGLPRHVQSLPTWAEDFTTYRDIGGLWTRFMIMSRYFKFEADDYTTPIVDVVNDNSIRMRGLNCDTITATGRFLGEKHWNHVSEEDIRELANDWKIWLQQLHGPGCNLQTKKYAALWEIFLRTLLGDEITNNQIAEREASADDLEELKSFLTGTSAATNTIILSLKSNLVYQKLFHTSKGWIGIGPATATAGDEVWVFYGGKMPFIMRSGSTYEMIGEAYVHGIMHGEAMSMSLNEGDIIVT